MTTRKYTFSLTALIALLALALTGCGLLDQAQPNDSSLILPTNTVEPIGEVVAIDSDFSAERGALQEEIDTLKEQVTSLTEVLESQRVELDSAETAITQIEQSVNQGSPSDSPIIVNPETPVVQTNTPVTTDLQDALTRLYDIANPSTVFILVANQQGLGGSGSGFVYDINGHIVTNNHVVEGATDIIVVFSDGTRVDAELVGTDVDSDLAVIRAESLPDGVLPIPLSSMAQVDVGQFAVAIGNPFGEQGSMSLGIISGLGRSLSSQRILDGTGGTYQLPQVIQTDAPINPGNSGGPLLNLSGEVIGVNSAIRTTTGQNSGVGFSIPVDAVRIIIPELIANGSYTYPYLGVSFADETRKQAILEQSGIDTAFGAYVVRAAPGLPAAQAGLRSSDASGFGGDLITALNGQPIKDFDDLNAYLVFNTKPGEILTATVLRDGELIEIDITLGERPQ